MGIIIGLIIGLIIAIFPAVLIAFSKLISGKRKILWVVCTLVVPYLLKKAAGILVIAIQGNALPYGLGPVIPLTWYISSWALYLIFIIKYGSQKGKRNAKLISITIIIITVILIANIGEKIYMEKESETIINCGSEKIFTKNDDPKKLYITASYIPLKPSFFIGKLEGDSIVISSKHKNIRPINDCLKYSNKYKIIYPEGSKYTRKWAWEKQTEILKGKLVYSSKEELCSDGKYDKHEYYDYRMWQKQHGINIKTTKDSFLFNVNNIVHKTKAETIEFSNSIGSSFASDEYIYIIRTSIISSSKIILWKFSKGGIFVKEIHIVLPEGMILEEGKYHPISHVEITKDKIRFRVYTTYQGNKEQHWRSMCRYSVIEVKNENLI